MAGFVWPVGCLAPVKKTTDCPWPRKVRGWQTQVGVNSALPSRGHGHCGYNSELRAAETALWKVGKRTEISFK